eukprot:scaffold6963_cov110-Isochrysis_galbana.AAC.4
MSCLRILSIGERWTVGVTKFILGSARGIALFRSAQAPVDVAELETPERGRGVRCACSGDACAYRLIGCWGAARPLGEGHLVLDVLHRGHDVGERRCLPTVARRVRNPHRSFFSFSYIMGLHSVSPGLALAKSVGPGRRSTSAVAGSRSDRALAAAAGRHRDGNQMDRHARSHTELFASRAATQLRLRTFTWRCSSHDEPPLVASARTGAPLRVPLAARAAQSKGGRVAAARWAGGCPLLRCKWRAVPPT